MEKQSTDSYPVVGGKKMVLSGHNFLQDSKVIFVEKAPGTCSRWQDERLPLVLVGSGSWMARCGPSIHMSVFAHSMGNHQTVVAISLQELSKLVFLSSLSFCVAESQVKVHLGCLQSQTFESLC